MMFDIDGLDEFIADLDSAINGSLQDDMAEWLDAMGLEFLDIIQQEIIRTQTVDTRRLLNSFHRNDSDNVYSTSSGGLSLDVGTNVNYASFVNDGHFTIDPASGKSHRFVPGYWNGNRFVYVKGHDEGMMLKQQWVEGSNYWNNAFVIFERFFGRGLDNLLQEWLDSHFG